MKQEKEGLQLFVVYAYALFIVGLTFLMCCEHRASAVPSEQRIHKDINKLLNALHQVEASGRLGAIKGDSGNALGPFQIWKPYYQDAVQKSKGRLNRSYKAVSDLDYAKQVVLWYFYRYEPEALKNGNFESLARLHHLGPNWKNKKRLGDKYWGKVKRYL